MKMIKVSLRENPYKIVIGREILSQLGTRLKKLNLGCHAVIVTDPHINQHHGKVLIRGLKRSGITVKVFTVPQGEKSKSAKMALGLMEKIARYDVMKNAFIIAFGGGVVGDLAGYVAAAYKRGVPYIQVPTTLLAQIDSAIGGKVGVDLPIGKNLIGAFYQPKLVYSDVSLLATLSKRQIKNGLAEAVKYGVIDDKHLFHYIDKNVEKIIQADLKTLLEVVIRCSRIKTKVVVADEKETKNIRTILNFGHTVGHAIEAAGGYSTYHHGEAIALGMRVAMDISHQKRLVSSKEAKKLNEVLTKIGLPQKILKVRINDILRFMMHDKKFLQGRNRFVLAKKIGEVKVVSDVPRSIIVRAIQKSR